MSILAAVIAGVIAFMIGGAWYGFIFKEAWIKEVGITEEQINDSNNGMKEMIYTFLLEIVVAFLVFFLLSHTDLNIFCAGFTIAIIAIFSALKNYFFEMKSFKLIAINESYKLICIMIMTLAAYFFA
ncbi:DUF1761 domain-containing protein [Macrococcoides caseolyticum]|uniref:DUF1761 domain-containing protein n=1 Tax=Macrococcoides caseolyticum TaxID=69966 RepID=UPI001F3F31DB|nr:DUF1761 domain-containing protein [Macrococcus caseolyticus]MCE4957317.1 DUF1761 domain-containing protein [Macrococcus caseolyticus]